VRPFSDAAPPSSGSDMKLLLHAAAVLLAAGLADAAWFDGIESIKVFSPGDDVSSFSWNLYNGNMEKAQFSDKRYALLLKPGDYGDAQIAVGYYTSLLGTGALPNDVKVGSFFTMDNPDVGNACDNFWRHVEGITATHASVTWAASQAAPLRRIHVQGELWLSENGSPHWSSGGLLSDSVIDGPLYMGTQQQYLVRNSKLGSGAVGASMNYVFVGVEGGPASSSDGTITSVDASPRAAVKPYLVERQDVWSIEVPQMESHVSGLQPLNTTSIDFSQVYVAKEGDTAESINTGISGKKALLLTPAIYDLDKAILITSPGFVVLGIGFPTLVANKGNAAIEVHANDVRVASVLLEAGTPVAGPATEALLVWNGNNGVAADIFSRVGAFSYSRAFKPSCLKTRADVHVEINGAGFTAENMWLWHADHDDCPGGSQYSDESYSANGLVVNGDDAVVYGLKAEHTFGDIVSWHGDKGQVYLFQAEMPYHVPNYTGVAYHVAQSVKEHAGFGIGVYQISGYTVDTAARVPPSAQMRNVFSWCITGSNTHFRSVVCTSEGPGSQKDCYHGDRCTWNACYQYKLPEARSQIQV